MVRLRRDQQGVGMVEVLVALLLLAIAVMGFIALQVRAASAGGEAFEKTQAMAIAQDLGERVRLNPTEITFYATAANWKTGLTLDGCETGDCTSLQTLAQYDIAQVMNSAATLLPNGQARMAQCQGSVAGNVFHCIYVSWNDTTPTAGEGAADCVTTAGTYRTDATCVMMEAY